MRAQTTQNGLIAFKVRGLDCTLRGLPTSYRVLYQAQGWRQTLSSGGKHCPLWGVGASWQFTVEFKNDYVLGFIICEILTVIALQDWVRWGIFTVIPGYPRRKPAFRGTPRITGLAPVRIIYRKKLKDRAFVQIIR